MNKLTEKLIERGYEVMENGHMHLKNNLDVEVSPIWLLTAQYQLTSKGLKYFNLELFIDDQLLDILQTKQITITKLENEHSLLRAKVPPVTIDLLPCEEYSPCLLEAIKELDATLSISSESTLSLTFQLDEYVYVQIDE